MCGRYTEGRHRPEKAEKALGELIKRKWPDRTPRYNVSPGTPVPVIRVTPEEGAELVELKWGLLPYWSKEPRIAFNTINAMAETVETKASYRTPFRKRRCLVPADGWYEWQAAKTGKRKWWFHLADDSDLCFAGLWDRWQGDGQVIDSCTIVVTDAANSIRQMADRMPVIIAPADYQFWLDPGVSDVPALKQLLKPTAAPLEARPVANPKHPQDNDASLIAPVATDLFQPT